MEGFETFDEVEYGLEKKGGHTGSGSSTSGIVSGWYTAFNMSSSSSSSNANTAPKALGSNEIEGDGVGGISARKRGVKPVKSTPNSLNNEVLKRSALLLEIVRGAVGAGDWNHGRKYNVQRWVG